MTLTRAERTKLFNITIYNEWINSRWQFILKNENKINWDCLSENSYLPIELVTNNPDKPWNYEKIVYHNFYLNLTIIENNINLPWDWEHVSRLPGLTIHFIKKHINKSWNWNHICKHHSINPTDLIKEFSHISLNFNCLSRNPNLSAELVIRYFDEPWDIEYISRHEKIIFEIVDYCFENNKHYHFNWKTISSNVNLTPQFFDKYYNQPGWSYSEILYNKNMNEHIIAYYHHIMFDNTTNIRRLNNVLNNLPLNVIEKYSYLNYWNWNEISKRECVNIHIISNNLDKNWNWEILSEHPNISAQNIIDNIDFPWVWENVSHNPDINGVIRLIKLYPNKNWNWGYLIQYLPLELLEQHIDDIDLLFICNNPNINIDFIIKHNFDYNHNSSICYGISIHKNTTLDDVLRYPEFKWNPIALTHNYNFNINWIEALPNFKWDWCKIFNKYELTDEFINKYINELSYNNVLKAFSGNKYLSVKHYIKYQDKQLDWHIISNNPNITMSDISNNPNLPWVPSSIIYNINFNLDIIDVLPNMNWDWYTITRLIFTHPYGLYYKSKIYYKSYKIEKYREYMAAYKIQQFWFNVTSNPDYAICRRKIANDYDKYKLITHT